NISGGTIQGNIVGNVSGENAGVMYTSHALDATAAQASTPALTPSSKSEAVASAQTQAPNVHIGIGALPDLTPIDTLVLKLSCEESISVGNIYIDTSNLLPKATAVNIPHNEMHESIDILDRKGYIEATRANTGIPHFSITLSGFEAYAKHFMPEYQSIFQLVIAKIVNDHITQNKLLAL